MCNMANSCKSLTVVTRQTVILYHRRHGTFHFSRLKLTVPMSLVSKMTYYVSSGTLNTTHSPLSQSNFLYVNYTDTTKYIISRR